MVGCGLLAGFFLRRRAKTRKRVFLSHSVNLPNSLRPALPKSGLMIEALRGKQLARWRSRKTGRTSCAGSTSGVKPGEYPSVSRNSDTVRYIFDYLSTSLRLFWFFYAGTLQLRPGSEFGTAPSTTAAPRARRRFAELPPPFDRRLDDPDRIATKAAATASPNTNRARSPSPSELDDDEYATSPPNLGFFSTGGGASANRRFSTTGAGGDGGARVPAPASVGGGDNGGLVRRRPL